MTPCDGSTPYLQGSSIARAAASAAAFRCRYCARILSRSFSAQAAQRVRPGSAGSEHDRQRPAAFRAFVRSRMYCRRTFRSLTPLCLRHASRACSRSFSAQGSQTVNSGSGRASPQDTQTRASFRSQYRRRAFEQHSPHFVFPGSGRSAPQCVQRPSRFSRQYRSRARSRSRRFVLRLRRLTPPSGRRSPPPSPRPCPP